MARIFTPPDIDMDRSIPKVFIRNCTWTLEQIQELAQHLSDKNYDIYLYKEEDNDIQWAEGVRTMTDPKYVYYWNHHQNNDPLLLLRKIDDEF